MNKLLPLLMLAALACKPKTTAPDPSTDDGTTETSGSVPDVAECPLHEAAGYCCECYVESVCEPGLLCWPSPSNECVGVDQAWCANAGGSLDECAIRCGGSAVRS